MRTNLATPDAQRGRLRKALAFADVADITSEFLSDDGVADVFVSLAVLSGIAAADVLCMSRLGEYARGQSHDDAVRLLARADPKLANHLRTLLSLKSKAEYAPLAVSGDDVTRAGRAMSALLVAARGG